MGRVDANPAERSGQARSGEPDAVARRQGDHRIRERHLRSVQAAQPSWPSGLSSDQATRPVEQGEDQHGPRHQRDGKRQPQRKDGPGELEPRPVQHHAHVMERVEDDATQPSEQDWRRMTRLAAHGEVSDREHALGQDAARQRGENGPDEGRSPSPRDEPFVHGDLPKPEGEGSGPDRAELSAPRGPNRASAGAVRDGSTLQSKVETICCTRSATWTGLRPTGTPAASNASALAWAVPLEPVMMAPAWPIRLPGGALNPAT